MASMNVSPSSPVPWGALWTRGHFGWTCLPPYWNGRCAWGWPYIPTTVCIAKSNGVRLAYCSSRRVCAVIKINCYIHIPDCRINVSSLMEDTKRLISQIDSLREAPVATWFSNINWIMKSILIVVAGFLLFCILVPCCSQFYQMCWDTTRNKWQ